MEISTISNDTMNLTCFEEAEKKIKEIEELKQENHLLKLQIERSTSYKSELEAEVERLESLNKSIVVSYEEKIHEIEKNYTERISRLQAVQDEDREQAHVRYVELETRFQQLLAKEASKTTENSCAVLSEDILHSSCKIEIQDLKQELNGKKEEICKLECAQLEMSDKLNELQKELEALNECNKCKSDNLQATMKALEEMREEKALLSSELAVLKAGPVEDHGRGNSLFSEIEDKRAVLEKKLSMMHTKYLEMKRILVLKNNELESLKGEHLKFQLRWEEDERNEKSKEKMLIRHLKERIEELEHRINELETKRPENPTIVTISEKNMSNMQWIHTIVEAARAEARDMRHALEEKSREGLLRDENLYELSSDVKSLRRQIAKDQAIIADLQNKLESLESSTPILEEKREKVEISKKSLRFAEDVKENDGVPLKKEPKKNEITYPVLLVDKTNEFTNNLDRS